MQTEDVGMMKAGHEDRHGDWMETSTGTRFFPLDPRPEEVHLEDLAHHLSRINRYNGASCLDHYSVAEHSVRMAVWVLDEYGDEELARQALLHDSPEAYIGDMVRPLKRQPEMRSFVHADESLYAVIAIRFGLRTTYLDDRIKDADNRILADERPQVMNPSPNPWGIDHMEPLGITIEGWEPYYAKARFLQVAEQLGIK